MTTLSEKSIYRNFLSPSLSDRDIFTIYRKVVLTIKKSGKAALSIIKRGNHFYCRKEQLKYEVELEQLKSRLYILHSKY